VFKIAGRDVPIVHRVHRRHERAANASSTSNGGVVRAAPAAGTAATVDYLTKGDNNAMDDRDLYAPGQLWLSRGEILGKAVAYVPYLGMVTILLNDYPALKVVLLGLMGLFVLTGKET
jgi:signal peptidase